MVKDSTIGLREAADVLGVHYMTAYRHVRTGRLPAHLVGGRWRVELADLHPEDTVAGPPGTRIPLEERRARLMVRLTVGDEPGGWRLVEEALASGFEPARIYTDLLLPVLSTLGDDWAAGRATVADEHRATAVATRIVGRLGPRFARRGVSRGTVVLGMCSGDHHALPSAILADLLRGEGFTAVDLGADTPSESFVDAWLRSDRLVAVLIGVTPAGLEGAVADTVTAIHGSGCTAPVFLGGRAIGSARAADDLGADGWTGCDAVLAVSAVSAVTVAAGATARAATATR